MMWGITAAQAQMFRWEDDINVRRRRETEKSYMSYARWGCDNSDVYVYMHTSGYLECFMCTLTEPEGPHQARSTGGMIRHLDKHQAEGDHVPPYVRKELIADGPANFPPAKPKK